VEEKPIGNIDIAAEGNRRPNQEPNPNQPQPDQPVDPFSMIRVGQKIELMGGYIRRLEAEGKAEGQEWFERQSDGSYLAFGGDLYFKKRDEYRAEALAEHAEREAERKALEAVVKDDVWHEISADGTIRQFRGELARIKRAEYQAKAAKETMGEGPVPAPEDSWREYDVGGVLHEYTGEEARKKRDEFEELKRLSDLLPKKKAKKINPYRDISISYSTTSSTYMPSKPAPNPAVAPKEDAGPATRRSVFGNEYPQSVEADWQYYDGVGWVNMSKEERTFKEWYAVCAIDGKWHRGDQMVRATKSRLIHKDSLKGEASAKWGVCAVSGSYTEKEDLVKALNRGKDTVWVSKWYIDQQGGLKTCDFTKVEGYLPQSMYKITGSETYHLVSEEALADRTFIKCGSCGTWTERATEIVKGRHDAGGYTLCEGCYAKELRKHIIGRFDCADYPPLICTKVPRRAAKKMEDGYRATGQIEMTPSLRIYGVELELEMALKGMKRDKVDRFRMAEDIKNVLGSDFVMIKEDGSLLANGKYSDSSGPGPLYAGFEVVSAPADMPIHKERWFRLPNLPFFKHLRAWDMETCGMHVHTDLTQISNLQLGRILHFCNHKGNRPFMIKIAGRGEDLYCRFMEHQISDVYHKNKVISPEEPDSHHRARRVAINVSGSNTFEFRIFRGTVNPKHIMRNIEFCDSLIEYCLPASRSISLLKTPDDFILFIAHNAKRWPMLASWFWKVGMIKLRRAPDPAKADLSKMTLREDLVEEPEIKTESPKRPDPSKRDMGGGGIDMEIRLDNGPAPDVFWEPPSLTEREKREIAEAAQRAAGMNALYNIAIGMPPDGQNQNGGLVQPAPPEGVNVAPPEEIRVAQEPPPPAPEPPADLDKVIEGPNRAPDENLIKVN
jgi:hypothetical protein